MHQWHTLLSSLLDTTDELFPQIETLYGVPAHALVTRQMLLDDRIQWAEDQLPYSQLIAVRLPERIAFAEGTKNEFVRSHDLDALSAMAQCHAGFVAALEEFVGGPMPGPHLHIKAATSAPSGG